MKTTFPHAIRLALTLASLFVLSSCSFEREIGEPVPPVVDGMTDISFMVRMPAVTAVQTRGETGTVAENRINDIHVLVFETSGKLIYRGKGRNVEASGVNNGSVAFKAALPVGETYDFMVLANAESLLSGISAGAVPAQTRDDVESLVLQATAANSEAGKWKPSAPIPMWDAQQLTLTASSRPVFYLMRMLARVNVEYKPSEDAADVFRLTDIRYYNYNTSGKVIPEVEDNMEGEEGGRYVTRPTLPANPGTRLGESFSYTEITDGKTCKNLIYVFEAKNQGTYADDDKWINNPCLVIGGRYDSDGDGDFENEPVTWYRIDFLKKTNTGGTTTDQWLSILRNFSYNVVISSVSGDGYNDPDAALKSVPMNMSSEVIDWNDGQLGEIAIDGTYFLSVGYSRNESLRKAASLYRNATSTDEMEFNTNIALDQFKMVLTQNGANIVLTELEKAADVVAKIANEFYEVKIVKGDVVNGVNYGKFVFTALKDHVASNPVSTLTVTSGRIRYEISISQRNADPQDWNDGGNKEEILG